jgi:hypothetical protein
MNREKSVKVETKVEKTRQYRRPEVHDLGKLEQVRGGWGPNDELRAGRYILRPIL